VARETRSRQMLREINCIEKKKSKQFLYEFYERKKKVTCQSRGCCVRVIRKSQLSTVIYTLKELLLIMMMMMMMMVMVIG
jgi:hypothetical protein